jgi:hypothetical protein
MEVHGHNVAASVVLNLDCLATALLNISAIDLFSVVL